MSTAFATSGRNIVWIATALIVLIKCIVVFLLPIDMQRDALQEGGLVETMSAIGYLICIALMFIFWGPAETLSHWYFSVILVLFAGRELDLDKTSFTEGLLKSRQYIGDTVPAGERAISAVLLLIIIAVVITLIVRESKPFLRGLRSGYAPAYAFLTSFIILCTVKTLDGLDRKLEPFGIIISKTVNQMATSAEELGEFGIPVMFAIAIVLAARSVGDAKL